MSNTETTKLVTFDVGFRQDTSDQVRRNVVTLWAEDDDHTAYVAIEIPHPDSLDGVTMTNHKLRVVDALHVLTAERVGTDKRLEQAVDMLQAVLDGEDEDGEWDWDGPLPDALQYVLRVVVGRVMA